MSPGIQNLQSHLRNRPYKSSVFRNGSPLSPLNTLRNRRSLELESRRMILGATRSPVSRRARRPLSQSSQLITSFIGIVGTPDIESFGFFMNQLSRVLPVIVFFGIRQPSHLDPIHLQF